MSNRLIKLLIACFLIFVLAFTASYRLADMIEDNLKDQARQKLRASGHEWVDVSPDGLILTVSGEAQSQEDYTEALASAKSIRAAHKVINKLTAPPEPVVLAPLSFNAQKDADAISLSGDLATKTAQSKLVTIAQQSGLEVIDLTTVLKQQDNPEFLLTSETGLKALVELRAGSLNITETSMDIEGFAETFDDKDRIEAELNSALPKSYEHNLALTSSLPTVVPYVFHLSKSENGMEIKDCAVPSENDLAIIKDLAQGIDVSGFECQVALGVPNNDWTNAITVGMDTLPQMLSGDFDIVDNEARLSGVLPENMNVQPFVDQFKSNFPSSYSLKTPVSKQHPYKSPYEFTAFKENDTTTIKGYMPDEMGLQTLAGTIGTITDTSVIQSEYIIARGAPDNWQEALEAGATALAKLENGSLSAKDNTITISGLANDTTADEIQQMIAEINIEPYSYEFTHFSPAIESEANHFNATLNDDKSLILSGTVPDDIFASTTQAYSAAVFIGSEISSEMIIQGGATPTGWQNTAVAGLEALSSLDYGQVDLSEEMLSVTGSTNDADAESNIKEMLLKKVPADFKFTTDIDFIAPSEAISIPSLSRVDCSQSLNKIVAQQPIEFESGSAIINSDSLSQIEALADTLKQCTDGLLEIGGHTDSKGSDTLNQILSYNRAESVRNALTNQGVPPNRFIAKGYGEDNPIADNDTAEGRAKNRRIEFTFRE